MGSGTKNSVSTLAFAIASVLALSAPGFAQAFIVQDGRPNAEIVVAPDAPGMVKLAAKELRTHIERITGATLQVVTALTDEFAVKVYVGRSDHTDRLGVAAEGLEHGAFRMASGEDWLVLLGDDTPFEPPGPWTPHRGRGNPETLEAQAEWDRLSGGMYNWPLGKLGKDFTHGKLVEDERLWHFDQRGSLNAVHEFLRGLGVRWYMPGELGEIVPRTHSVPLPQVDRVVRPDFAMRTMHVAHFRTAPEEDILWYLRLGLNHGEMVGHWSHGIRDVTGRDEMKEAHPEYYALAGGRRDTAGNRSCLSSEGLFRENVRFARAMFDVYDAPMVSVMPQDGYGGCHCELCEGKLNPERGNRGRLSNYVWEYVNRVAKEVRKTHPDRKILCFSYGGYTLPPENIDRLSPNVVVGIVHGRGKFFPENPTVYAARGLDMNVMDLREQWLAMTDNPVVLWEHYVFTHRGTFLPVYFPRAIARGLRSLKGVALGEFVEVASDGNRGHAFHAPIFNHLNIYVTARLYWDVDQDLEAMLDEYYGLFYGPAAEEMAAFVDYCEANWRDMRDDVERIDRAMDLFEAAQEKVDPESDYARRLDMLGEYLIPLAALRDQRVRGREGVPQARAPWIRQAADLTLDGRLDEPIWEQASEYRLRDAKTGDAPRAAASFRALWTGGRLEGTLHLGIRSEEPDIANMAVSGRQDGDTAIFDGDTIEILIETAAHSYYQIVVNPAGRVMDIDRRGGINPRWSAQAAVASHIGEDYWSVEIRLPVTGEDLPADPNHQLAGRRPVDSLPWFVNVCRQRVRPDGIELSAWSPTGADTFHNAMKFGRLIVR